MIWDWFLYLATKGAGLLGKTEWTDDEDEEEEQAVAENAPTMAEAEEVATENQAEENQESEADVPTNPTETNENETLKSVDDRPEVQPEVPVE